MRELSYKEIDELEEGYYDENGYYWKCAHTKDSYIRNGDGSIVRHPKCKFYTKHNLVHIAKPWKSNWSRILTGKVCKCAKSESKMKGHMVCVSSKLLHSLNIHNN